MSKPIKILLGLATLWPFVYMILFFAFIFSTFLFLSGPNTEGSGPPVAFVVIFPLHLLTMLIIMALTVFYMVNVFRNERVDKDKKVLWAVVLFMGNMVSMPIYWYLYIWKELEVVATPLPLREALVGNGIDQQDFASRQEVPNWRE